MRRLQEALKSRGGIAPIALGLLLAGCVPDVTPEERAARDVGMQELIAKRVEAEERLAARERELGAVIARLEAENVDLRAQLGLAEKSAAESAAEAARYQQGLGKAVDELNRVSTESREIVSRARSAPAYRPAQRTARPNVSYHSPPHLSIVERSVVASGRLYNSGEADAIGTLELELVMGGEVLETKEQPFRVNANSWATWNESFTFTPRPGMTPAVQARMRY